MKKFSLSAALTGLFTLGVNAVALAADSAAMVEAAKLFTTTVTVAGIGISVAASVTEYLLRRGDKARLLRFAVSGKTAGWDTALREHYGLRSAEEFQQAWQAWAGRTALGSLPAPVPGSDRLSATARPTP